MAEGEFNVTTSQKLVYMPDQLGATRDVIDATTGTRVQSYDYEPYGAIARTNGTTPTDYQYASLFAHPQSTLNLSATRAYDPATGRWLNKDPIREAGGLNLYGYVNQNPIMLIDPLGQFGQPGWFGANYTWGDLIIIASLFTGPQTGLVWDILRGAGNVARAAEESTPPPTNCPNAITPRPDYPAQSGGRSGENVKNLTGPPNSAIRGQGERIYITDKDGRVVVDVDKNRAKDISPGVGAIGKRPPTPEEGNLLNQLIGGQQ